MNTCGTCKHRGDPIQVRDYDYIYQGQKAVMRIDFRPVPLDGDGCPAYNRNFFLCARIKHAEPDHAENLGKDSAFVKDGSGYYAALCVEDDFGCVMWEAR